ncbi:MAG: acyl-CoA thioesterase [Candidatus Eremiobacteraeota bacterium]|nr:acyl-CoA thioesterase [Candidatus Eremiobacteraeota bacterium]MBV9057385.1 acyl-CoA thioesterase [Candidatus Eremiobacteraeota bacterium]
MKPILTYRGTVFPWQCDHMGHMNVMWYVGKFDEATWNLLAAVGITPAYLRETNRGMAGVQQNIAYKRELFAGAIVEVWSHFVSFGERKCVFVHEMRDGESGEVCATCELTAVHIDRTTRRAVPFPRELRMLAETALAMSP